MDPIGSYWIHHHSTHFCYLPSFHNYQLVSGPWECLNRRSLRSDPSAMPETHPQPSPWSQEVDVKKSWEAYVESDEVQLSFCWSKIIKHQLLRSWNIWNMIYHDQEMVGGQKLFPEETNMEIRCWLMSRYGHRLGMAMMNSLRSSKRGWDISYESEAFKRNIKLEV